MIEVELPDGTIAEFPDGTSQDVIKGALQKRFGAPRAAKETPSAAFRAADLAATMLPGIGAAKDAVQAIRDPQRALSEADAGMRLAANGLTLGMADRIASWLPGSGSVQDEAAKTQAARDQLGLRGNAVELAGNVVGAGKLAQAGLTAAKLSPVAAALIGKVPGLSRVAAPVADMAAGVADALGMNVIANYGQGRDLGENAGIAAGLGAAAPLVGRLIAAVGSKIAGIGNPKPATMTADELKAAARAAYGKAEQTGAMFTPQAMQRLAAESKADYAQMGFHPGLQPRAGVVLNELDRLAPQNVGITGMEAARKLAKNAYDPTNQSSNLLTGGVASRIDDLMVSPQPGDVVGDSGTASAALKDAREMWRRGRNVERLQELFGRGELNAATSGSGGNLQNATRQQLKRVLTSDNLGRTFTPAELAEVEQFVKGTPTQNILRALGQVGPSGNGLMKALWGIAVGGAGMGFGLPALAGVGAAAGATSGAKKIAEALTRAKYAKMERAIASGAPPAVKNATQKMIESSKDAIARALLGALIPGIPAVTGN